MTCLILGCFFNKSPFKTHFEYFCAYLMFFPAHALTPSHPTSPFSRWWQASPHLIDWSHPLCHTDHTPPNAPLPLPANNDQTINSPIGRPQCPPERNIVEKQVNIFYLVLFGLEPFLGFFHRKIEILLFSAYHNFFVKSFNILKSFPYITYVLTFILFLETIP